MTRTRLIIAGVAAVVLIGAGGFATVYFTMFNPRPVATVSLPATPAASPTGELGGRWTVATGSFVGYRVREQLAQLPAPSDAVGRTTAVTGSARVVSNGDGTATVSAIDVKADLTQLASDAARRDNYLRHSSLETSSFPSAGFVSQAGFSVPAAVVAGAAGQVTLPGTFTIHGQSKSVTLTLKVQRDGTAVNVVGSYTFQWGDYGVSQPSVPVASVQSDPTIEISLVLKPLA